MASTDDLTAAQRPGGSLHRRSSSMSHYEELPEEQSVKRRRTHSFFFRRDSSPESGDDCDQPLTVPRRRRSSAILSLFHRSKNSRERTAYQKLPDTSRATTTGEEAGTLADQLPSPWRASTPSPPPPPPVQHGERRRSSVAKILRFFRRKRKDSVFEDGSFDNTPIQVTDYSHAIPNNEVQYFNASLEPLATDGVLRFQNSSVDALETIDGPSDFYLKESYHERPCTIRSRSPVRSSIPPALTISQPEETLPGESQDWVPELTSAPTAETNAEAGVAHDPHRWRSLNGYSPAPSKARSRRNSLQLHMPNFIQVKKSRRTLRSANRNPSPAIHNSNADGPSRAPSNAPSTVSATTRFSNNPDPFGAGPDLHLRSINELGVLPLIEASSLESSTSVPNPTFIYPSATSSTVALHTLSYPHSHTDSPSRFINWHSQCPPSPAISATRLAPPPASSLLRLPSPQFRTPRADAARTASTTRIPSLLDLAESYCWSDTTAATAATAADDDFNDQDLQLRRMRCSLVDVLSSLHVNGQGSIGCNLDDYEYVESSEASDDECEEASGCCDGRGRSRVRRG